MKAVRSDGVTQRGQINEGSTKRWCYTKGAKQMKAVGSEDVTQRGQTNEGNTKRWCYTKGPDK